MKLRRCAVSEASEPSTTVGFFTLILHQVPRSSSRLATILPYPLQRCIQRVRGKHEQHQHTTVAPAVDLAYSNPEMLCLFTGLVTGGMVWRQRVRAIRRTLPRRFQMSKLFPVFSSRRLGAVHPEGVKDLTFVILHLHYHVVAFETCSVSLKGESRKSRCSTTTWSFVGTHSLPYCRRHNKYSFSP